MSNFALWQVEEIELGFTIYDLRLTHSWSANRKSEIVNHNLWRGCSSVGRAVALQAIGQEFESPQLHQPSLAAKQERGCRAVAKAKADG